MLPAYSDSDLSESMQFISANAEPKVGITWTNMHRNQRAEVGIRDLLTEKQQEVEKERDWCELQWKVFTFSMANTAPYYSR